MIRKEYLAMIIIVTVVCVIGAFLTPAKTNADVYRTKSKFKVGQIVTFKVAPKNSGMVLSKWCGIECIYDVRLNLMNRKLIKIENVKEFELISKEATK